MACRKLADARGFTLLEVLIAFAILAIAIVSLIQLSAQGLRLLKVSGDHQRAVELGDRIAMETQVNADDVKPDAPLVESGEEGALTWERRIARLPLPDEIESRATIPGKEAPGLYTVSVAVRSGQRQLVEVATLRSPSPPASSSASTTPTTTPNAPGQAGTQPPGTPGAAPTPSGSSGAATPGAPGTGSTPTR
jgi:prepilin-type N-terminal cleavage/methylation domain-containing protein